MGRHTRPVSGHYQTRTTGITLHHRSALLVGTTTASTPTVSLTRRAFSRTRAVQRRITIERCGLAEVDRPNLRTYWQPVPGATHLHALTELDPVLGHLEHLHVFSWATDSSRLPLTAHESLWRRVLTKVANQHNDRQAYAYLEFVPDDAPEALTRDAATLRGWLEELT
jgi:hypothetical protein